MDKSSLPASGAGKRVHHHFYRESVQAMSRFAGPDPTRIHHLKKDADYLLELPETVQTLRIVSST
jgi:hypothetical protein